MDTNEEIEKTNETLIQVCEEILSKVKTSKVKIGWGNPTGNSGKVGATTRKDEWTIQWCREQFKMSTMPSHGKQRKNWRNITEGNN